MKHNKKRNSGLLYEFLARHAAEGVVDGDDRKTRRSLKLLKRHFREGTELNKEFRLFRALLRTCVASKETAHRIIEASRRAAVEYDLKKLDHEKSLLIRSINHTFKDQKFYDKRIAEYKLYATVQMLLNEWRQDVPSDLVSTALYEEELVEHLLRPKQDNVLDESRDEVDDLLVNLMVKKANAKYDGVLNPEQLALMNAYVDGLHAGDTVRVRESIDALRTESLEAIDSLIESGGDPNVLAKLSEIRALISEPVTQVDDRVLARYLRIARLKSEMVRV